MPGGLHWEGMALPTGKSFTNLRALGSRTVRHERPCTGRNGSSPRDDRGPDIDSRRDGAERSVEHPLCRTEPILRKLAEARNPGRILFKHNVSHIKDEGEFVRVVVEDEEGQKKTYRAQYLVGADGGRTVGAHIGAVLEGGKAIADMVAVHAYADLSKYWDDRHFACYLVNGTGETILQSGAVVPCGPTWGKNSEEWVFGMGFSMDDKTRHQEDLLIDSIRALVKIPDLELDVLKISHWILDCVLASKYQEGRILIAGDSAHRHPPTTGLGLNTGIEDALNLAWKLSLVVKKKARPGILATYEQERRAVGRRNCDWALLTFENSSVMNAAVGLVAGRTEANQRRLEKLFDDSDDARSRLAQARRIIDSQDVEFTAHDIELGFRYEQGWRVSDGKPFPQPDPLGQVYTPTTRPGHRLPHAWLKEQGSESIVSTHDLVSRHGGFLVLTDVEGQDWGSAAERASRTYDIPIRTVHVGHDFQDLDGQWQAVKEVQEGGAILVRPDNFVAWRSQGPSARDGRELEEVLAFLLWGEGRTANVNGVASAVPT